MKGIQRFVWQSSKALLRDCLYRIVKHTYDDRALYLKVDPCKMIFKLVCDMQVMLDRFLGNIFGARQPVRHS